MPIYMLLLLALVQGVTEFLPISSSAHLELIHKIHGETPDDLVLDVAVHLGTLGAVILYFRREVSQAARGFLRLARLDLTTYEAHLALCLSVATLPVCATGLLIHLTGVDEALRSLAVIGWAMILFGLVLWWLDRRGASGKSAREWTIRDAWVIGLWQALALIPGTSRSGAAISGALAQGYERGAAARIAMLMSIPAIAATGTVLALEVGAAGDWRLGADVAIAAVLAFAAGLAALAVMMRLLKSVSYTPYVIYRVLLGVVILGFAYA